MPKSLDVLLGLSVIMLVVSMTVTMLTQATTSLLNSDGNRLRDGLVNLLRQIDPKLSGIAKELITAILTHPLIANSRGWLGSVIHRDEFTKLLLDFAAGTDPKNLKDESRKTLVEILKSNGIENPGTVLDKIRMTAIKLELEHPDWASSFSHDTAILQEASSPFVAKINGMFDQTIDRVSSRFTASARGITLVWALVVAFVLQLDTVGIVNSLWMSDSLRSQLVNVAENAGQSGSDALPSLPDAAASKAPTAVPSMSPAEAGPKAAAPPDTPQDDLGRNILDLRQLASRGLLTFPQTNLSAWLDSWRDVKFPGVILSALLLSMGAPFWYNALKTLLGLREKIAAKDEAQRTARQTSQGPIGTGPTSFAV